MRKLDILPAAAACLLIGLLVICAVNGTETAAISGWTEQAIDHYCASSIAERRKHCLVEIIPSLEKQPSDKAPRLLTTALRKLREWTDKDLAFDQRP